MNSRFHCAVDIIVKFIVMATKQRGGQRSALSHSGWQMLWRETHLLHEYG
jgi:hypothetical protein